MEPQRGKIIIAQAAMFSANQMIDIVIQTEQAGRAFYEAAVQYSGEPQVKSLCQWLADQEVAHERFFGIWDKTFRPR